MEKLEAIYPDAIEHTKNKIREDIYFYLGEKEEIVSFEDYFQDRKHYLEQIWINVWINRASNQVPRVEKKQYLIERGYEVEGVDRKSVNKLFRSEIKNYHPFEVEKWVYETYGNNTEQWDRLNEQAILEVENRKLEEEKQEEIYQIQVMAEELLTTYKPLFYLHVRKMVADTLQTIFSTKTRYQKVDRFALEIRLKAKGAFHPSDYSLLKHFLEELTGEIQRSDGWHQQFEYETYFDLFQSLTYEFVMNLISNIVEEKLKSDQSWILDIALLNLEEEMDDLWEELFFYVGDEYISDLLKLAEIPFEEEIHQRIFFEDTQLKQQRKAQEQAELQRKKEEEARILREIFEQEYNPPTGRNIHYVLHIGETNTGKTYQALQRMINSQSGMYLAPLRLLALEVFDFINGQGKPCSLKTGEEEKIIPEAQHISCTVEMFHEKDFFDVVVIDESQMISDKNRGFSWYKAITKVQANEVHIIASINAKEMLVQLLGDSQMDIIEYKREAPLEVEEKEFRMKDAKKGDALICFSRKRVLETASRLQNNGLSVSMIYGGMPPETRKKQVELFVNGKTSVVVATDAIGMGLNLPIRRIIFLENNKFDGISRRSLTSQEVKQIAGRAGRKGIYPIGKVAFTEEIQKMKKLLLQEDEPIHSFTIAPTHTVFEKFQKYYRDLETFFELWEKFKNPKGTNKASLTEEKELYRQIQGTEMEVRLPMMDLYGLLHLPFSTRESELIRQWKKTVNSIVTGQELPEPILKDRTLEDLELSYKAIGLHLLFLYRLNKRTDAIYWERVRENISDLVHEKLKTDVKKMKKRCKKCNKDLPWEHRFAICDECHEKRYRNNNYYYR